MMRLKSMLIAAVVAFSFLPVAEAAAPSAARPMLEGVTSAANPLLEEVKQKRKRYYKKRRHVSGFCYRKPWRCAPRHYARRCPGVLYRDHRGRLRCDPYYGGYGYYGYGFYRPSFGAWFGGRID